MAGPSVAWFCSFCRKAHGDILQAAHRICSRAFARSAELPQAEAPEPPGSSQGVEWEAVIGYWVTSADSTNGVPTINADGSTGDKIGSSRRQKKAVPAHSSGLPQRPAGVRVMIS